MHAATASHPLTSAKRTATAARTSTARILLGTPLTFALPKNAKALHAQAETSVSQDAANTISQAILFSQSAVLLINAINIQFVQSEVTVKVTSLSLTRIEPTSSPVIQTLPALRGASFAQH